MARECSGIRSTVVLFITSLLASHLFLKSPWRRFVLVAFVIPLAIVRNGFRILVIGLLCVHIGPHMIDSFIHHRGGPIFFVLSLIPLFVVPVRGCGVTISAWMSHIVVPPREEYGDRPFAPSFRGWDPQRAAGGGRTGAQEALAGRMVLLRRHGGLGVESVFTGLRLRAIPSEEAVAWLTREFVVKSFLPAIWLCFSLTYSRSNYREFLNRWKIPLLLAAVLPIGLAFGFSDQLFQAVPSEDRPASGHCRLVRSPRR